MSLAYAISEVPLLAQAIASAIADVRFWPILLQNSIETCREQ
jgi:hypothetical protein